MKKLIYLIVFTLFVISCSNKEEQYEFVENNYGQIHNDGLDYIFKDLNINSGCDISKLKSTTEDLIQQAVIATQEYIRIEAGEEAYRQAKVEITKEKYVTTSESELKKHMTLYSNVIMHTTIARLMGHPNSKSLSDIKLDIMRFNISNKEKQRLYDLMDVAKNSHLYWTEELKPLGPTIPPEDLSARTMSIIGSDCMWFWMGGLSSGLNPVVAGGSAAVGSFCAWYNGR